MKTNWKYERWEGQDFIIPGLDHAGVLSEREAKLVCDMLNLAEPKLALKYWQQGMDEAYGLIHKDGNPELAMERIRDARDERKEI
jgi:hypothetical protein